jgi:hypothetical protein
MNQTSFRRTILLGALCALGSGTAFAQALVLSASGLASHQYPVGTTIKYGSVLKAGDKLTILDANGTRMIVGPKVVTATADNTKSVSVASALVNAGAKHERLGAVRAMNAGPRVPDIGGKAPPSLWAVDVRYGGTRCFLPGMKPVLWRASEADTADFRLTADGQVVPVKWPAGAESIQLPVGSVYKVDTTGRSIQFKVKYLPDMPATAAAMRTELETLGCREQAGTLADNVNLVSN